MNLEQSTIVFAAYEVDSNEEISIRKRLTI
jgi:hypothetical protein